MRFLRNGVYLFLLSILFIAVVTKTSLAFDKQDLAKFKSTRICPKCDLQVANFEGMNLNLADLSGAFCTASLFDWTNMQGANLERAVLRATSFKKAYLEEANFKHARLQDADFEGAHMVKANFEQANLRGANFKDAIIIDANFNGAIWVDGDQCKQGSIGFCRK